MERESRMTPRRWLESTYYLAFYLSKLNRVWKWGFHCKNSPLVWYARTIPVLIGFFALLAPRFAKQYYT